MSREQDFGTQLKRSWGEVWGFECREFKYRKTPRARMLTISSRRWLGVDSSVEVCDRKMTSISDLTGRRAEFLYSLNNPVAVENDERRCQKIRCGTFQIKRVVPASGVDMIRLATWTFVHSEGYPVPGRTGSGDICGSPRFKAARIHGTRVCAAFFA